MPKDRPLPRFRARFWVIGLVGLIVFASTALAARSLRSFVATDSRFTLHAQEAGRLRYSGVKIEGAVHTPAARILQVFTPDFERSVYLMNLAERRRRLLAIDWVEDATISRVWPNHVLVHVRERKPVAYVNLPRHTFVLIDGEGVLLTPPPRATFEFPVLSGVWMEQTEAERKVRVQAALRMLDDLGPMAKDVSEVNASAPDDLRITAQVRNRAVELWIGDQSFGSRYRNFTEHFPEIAARSPRASVFDLRMDDRITAK